MPDWFAELSVALAQVLGLAAVVGPLLVWRAMDFVPAYRRRARLKRHAANGLLGHVARTELRALSARVILFLLATYTAVHFFVHVFGYLGFANWVIAERIGLDLAHVEQLARTARSMIRHTVVAGTAASALFGCEWLVQLVSDTYDGALPPAELSAVEVIPPAWRSSPAALWQSRTETEVAATPPWRENWINWAQTVTTLRRHVAVTLSKSDEGIE